MRPLEKIKEMKSGMIFCQGHNTRHKVDAGVPHLCPDANYLRGLITGWKESTTASLQKIAGYKKHSKTWEQIQLLEKIEFDLRAWEGELRK